MYYDYDRASVLLIGVCPRTEKEDAATKSFLMRLSEVVTSVKYIDADVIADTENAITRALLEKTDPVCVVRFKNTRDAAILENKFAFFLKVS
jgi:hypothetical protein